MPRRFVCLYPSYTVGRHQERCRPETSLPHTTDASSFICLQERGCGWAAAWKDQTSTLKRDFRKSNNFRLSLYVSESAAANETTVLGGFAGTHMCGGAAWVGCSCWSDLSNEGHVVSVRAQQRLEPDSLRVGW